RFRAWSVSQPRPRAARLPGASLSRSTSARSASASSSSRPRDRSTASVMPRFEVLSASQRSERSASAVPPQKGGRRRAGSPSGGSTFTTSAPRSPRTLPARKPGSCVRSRMRMPERALLNRRRTLAARRARCQVPRPVYRPSWAGLSPDAHVALRRRTMKIGIGIGDIGGSPADVDGLVAQAKRAEAEGFASGWFANIFGMDAILAAAICGRETSRIELGTAVVPTFPRHPVAMAQQALSAQAAARGRFTLGIGLSHQIVIEGMFGFSFAKPYSHMKEYLAVLGSLIRTGNVSHAGEEYRVNAQIAVPGATPCPILVAALAPRMLALTGREADGTITEMTGLRTIRDHTVPRIREAAATAGRPAPRVVVGLPVAVTRETAAARTSAAHGFQIYGALPSYRRMLDLEGVEGPGDVAIVGDESAVGEQLERLAEAGGTDFLGIPFRVDGDADAPARTRALLARRAARS